MAVRERSPLDELRAHLASLLRGLADFLAPQPAGSPGRDLVDDLLDKAPDDDEPLTDEERAAIDEAEAEIRAGRTVGHEELWAGLDRERG